MKYLQYFVIDHSTGDGVKRLEWILSLARMEDVAVHVETHETYTTIHVETASDVRAIALKLALAPFSEFEGRI